MIDPDLIHEETHAHIHTFFPWTNSEQQQLPFRLHQGGLLVHLTHDFPRGSCVLPTQGHILGCLMSPTYVPFLLTYRVTLTFYFGGK